MMITSQAKYLILDVKLILTKWTKRPCLKFFPNHYGLTISYHPTTPSVNDPNSVMYDSLSVTGIVTNSSL